MIKVITTQIQTPTPAEPPDPKELVTHYQSKNTLGELAMMQYAFLNSNHLVKQAGKARVALWGLSEEVAVRYEEEVAIEISDGPRKAKQKEFDDKYAAFGIPGLIVELDSYTDGLKKRSEIEKIALNYLENKKDSELAAAVSTSNQSRSGGKSRVTQLSSVGGDPIKLPKNQNTVPPARNPQNESEQFIYNLLNQPSYKRILEKCKPPQDYDYSGGALQYKTEPKGPEDFPRRYDLPPSKTEIEPKSCGIPTSSNFYSPPQIRISQNCIFTGKDATEFDGWLEWFLTTFERNNPSLTDFERGNYLKQCTSDEARKLIHHKSNADYPAMKQVLVQFFGDPANKQIELERKLAELVGVTEGRTLRDVCIDAHSLHEQFAKYHSDFGAGALIAKITSILPVEVQTEIRRQLNAPRTTNPQTFLDALRNAERTLVCPEKTLKSKSGEKSQKPMVLATATDKPDGVPFSFRRRRKCLFCEQSHFSSDCEVLKSVKERVKWLKEQKRCTRCTRPEHGECSANCFRCKGPHARSLCPETKKLVALATLPEQNVSEDNSEIAEQEELQKLVEANQMEMSDSDLGGDMETENPTICATFQSPKVPERLPRFVTGLDVTLSNPQNEEQQIECYALLDGCSSVNLITTSVAQQLNLKVQTMGAVPTKTVGGDRAIPMGAAKIAIKLQNGNLRELEVLVMPSLVGWISVPAKKAGRVVTRKAETQALFSSNLFYEVLKVPMRHVEHNIFEIPTDLGPLLVQRIEPPTVKNDPIVLTTQIQTGENWENAGEEFQDPGNPERLFWALENLGISPSEPTLTHDEEIRQKFEESLTFKDGRYQIRLLWKEPEPEIPDNRALAYHRTARWFKPKTDQQRAELQVMKKVFTDWIQDGILEPVTTRETDNPVYYMPFFLYLNKDPAQPNVDLSLIAVADLPL